MQITGTTWVLLGVAALLLPLWWRVTVAADAMRNHRDAKVQTLARALYSAAFTSLAVAALLVAARVTHDLGIVANPDIDLGLF